MKPFTWRIIDKTISYRISSTTITVLLVWWFTGRWDLSFTVGLLDVVLKTGWYYVHERIWAQIDWGKLKS